MEKLQQALRKARTQRGTASAEAEPAAAPAKTADALWEAMAPLAPSPRALRKHLLVSFEAGVDAAHFDVLRTKILLQMRKNNWKRLAITSPTAGCGKTTLACNLALSMSRQADIRTILFEMDLRQPKISKLLGTEPAHDVTEILTGKVSLADQAMRIRDTVAFAMARHPSEDPARYMNTLATQDALTDIDANYDADLLIFDLPPILTADDTRAFLNNVDCALIVARAERTKVREIDTSEREVAETTNVLGVVLNRDRFADQDTSY